MAEGEIPRRVTPATRMSPDEIATRGFASSFRGLSESDVRNFLRRVADDVAYSRDHERELLDRVEQLEQHLRHPAPLTEQQLLVSLGEETARVLRSAQGAAEDIRTKAQERSSLLVDQAQAEARRLTDEAEQVHADRLRVGEETAAEVVRIADADAAETRAAVEAFAEAERARATSEAEAEIEAARTKGRDMVAEARAVRERVLADLARRRTALQAQIDELRVGRERLLAAYKVVKDTLGEAVDALSRVETPAPGSVPTLPVDIPDVSAIEHLLDEEEPTSHDAVVADEPTERVVVVQPKPSPAPSKQAPPAPTSASHDDESDAAAPARDVDALFAKIRAARIEAVEEAREVLAGESIPHEPTEAEAIAAAAPSPAAGDPGDAALLATRDAALAPIERDLVKLAKRALQDEQNEILDALRKVKGKPTADTVLPALGAQIDAWAERLGGAIGAAYAAAHPRAGVPSPEITRGLTEQFIVPLRERVAATIGNDVGNADDAGQPDLDEADVAQRLGARYREWRAQHLEGAIGDVLSAAYAHGVNDGADEGTVLRWITVEGGCCPDCDDNTLEPTTRGEPFPTGQHLPPAHPGCRCLIAGSGWGVPSGGAHLHAVTS